MDTIYFDTQVSDELADRLRAMPKIELHVHLEGATEAATIWELARRNSVTLPVPTLEAWQAMYAFRDFNHFIEVYLTKEYLLLARQGFTWNELWQLNLNALEASFLAEEAKARYRAEWQAFAAHLS